MLVQISYFASLIRLLSFKILSCFKMGYILRTLPIAYMRDHKSILRGYQIVRLKIQQINEGSLSSFRHCKKLARRSQRFVRLSSGEGLPGLLKSPCDSALHPEPHSHVSEAHLSLSWCLVERVRGCELVYLVFQLWYPVSNRTWWPDL